MCFQTHRLRIGERPRCCFQIERSHSSHIIDKELCVEMVSREHSRTSFPANMFCELRCGCDHWGNKAVNTASMHSWVFVDWQSMLFAGLRLTTRQLPASSAPAMHEPSDKLYWRARRFVGRNFCDGRRICLCIAVAGFQKQAFSRLDKQFSYSLCGVSVMPENTYIHAGGCAALGACYREKRELYTTFDTFCSRYTLARPPAPLQSMCWSAVGAHRFFSCTKIVWIIAE